MFKPKRHTTCLQVREQWITLSMPENLVPQNETCEISIHEEDPWIYFHIGGNILAPAPADESEVNAYIRRAVEQRHIALTTQTRLRQYTILEHKTGHKIQAYLQPSNNNEHIMVETTNASIERFYKPDTKPGELMWVSYNPDKKFSVIALYLDTGMPASEPTCANYLAKPLMQGYKVGKWFKNNVKHLGPWALIPIFSHIPELTIEKITGRDGKNILNIKDQRVKPPTKNVLN